RKTAHRPTGASGAVHRGAGLGLRQHRLRRAGRPASGTPSRRRHPRSRFPGHRTDGRGAPHLGRPGRPHPAGTPRNPHRHPHRPGRGALPTHPHPPTPHQLQLITSPLPRRPPMRPARTPVYKTGALILAGLLFLTACGTAAPTDDDANAANNDSGYPVTVENCGTEVTFDAAPQRLVLLKSASVPALHALGVLDRAVARAGAFPDDYFDESTLAELDTIPQLTSDVDATGHLQISKDV